MEYNGKCTQWKLGGIKNAYVRDKSRWIKPRTHKEDIVPETGHLLNVENPGYVNMKIKEFMSDEFC